jgi:1-acyl-sn-glycerol-3-phosphate acyltransferase
MRPLTAPLRVVVLLLLILAGLATVACFGPLSQARRNRIIRGWSRLLLQVCGVRLLVRGHLPAMLAHTGIAPGGRLVLANHISWLDVYVINAALPSRFIAKSEIRGWPLIGTLVGWAGTLFIERGRRHAVHAANLAVRRCLEGGETVAVFAEGTTTEGDRLLPFHANLIAPAVEAGAPVWPVALCYTQKGRRSRAPAFVGDMGLLTSLGRTLLAPDLCATLTVLPPLPPQPTLRRHDLAEAARRAIGAELGIEAVEPVRAPRPRPGAADVEDAVTRMPSPAPDAGRTESAPARGRASASY